MSATGDFLGFEWFGECKIVFGQADVIHGTRQSACRYVQMKGL